MTVRWDNSQYENANAYMVEAEVMQNAGAHSRSWQLSFSARLAYLCDMVVNLVVLPFAIVGVIFGSLHALCTWKLFVLKQTKEFILEKSNHFFLSVCGSLVSPSLAHKYRDVNLAPYIVALRIIVIAALYLSYTSSK